MPNTPERPRHVSVDRDGPTLVEGPVTVVGEDGVAVTSHRFVVAVCTCRRSRTYPWCDTSHRRRVKGRPDGDTTARTADTEPDGPCGPHDDDPDSPEHPDGEAR